VGREVRESGHVLSSGSVGRGCRMTMAAMTIQKGGEMEEDKDDYNKSTMVELRGSNKLMAMDADKNNDRGQHVQGGC
jgi:hypothetical protein